MRNRIHQQQKSLLHLEHGKIISSYLCKNVWPDRSLLMYFHEPYYDCIRLIFCQKSFKLQNLIKSAVDVALGLLTTKLILAYICARFVVLKRFVSECFTSKVKTFISLFRVKYFQSYYFLCVLNALLLEGILLK